MVLKRDYEAKLLGPSESLFKLGQEREKIHSIAFGFSCQRNRGCRAWGNLKMEIPPKNGQLSRESSLPRAALRFQKTPEFHDKSVTNGKQADLCRKADTKLKMAGLEGTVVIPNARFHLLTTLKVK